MNNIQALKKTLITGVLTLIIGFVFWSFSSQTEPKDKDLIIGTWVEYDALKEENPDLNLNSHRKEFYKDGTMKTFVDNELWYHQKYQIIDTKPKVLCGRRIQQTPEKVSYLVWSDMDGSNQWCFEILNIDEEFFHIMNALHGGVASYKKYKN